MLLYLKWITLCTFVVSTSAALYGDMMRLTIYDDESLKSVFELMNKCSVSTVGYDSQCNSTSNTLLNNCVNSTGDFICCGSESTCYSSITVFFASRSLKLMKNYAIVNLHNVRFSGDNSTIECVDDNNSPGFSFIGITNLTIEHLSIVGCGMKHNSTNTLMDGSVIVILSAVYIRNSTNLVIRNVNISNSNGTGLSVVDTNGTISISDSSFCSNRVTLAETSNAFAGGGGIYIEFTECASGVSNCSSFGNLFSNASVLHIENCVFANNSAWYNYNGSLTADLDNNTYIGFGFGGGLSIQFNGQALNTFYVTVLLSSFSYNEANHGGGLSLYGRHNTSNINLNVSRCAFMNNYCLGFGGGGIVVGFVIFNADERVTQNTVIISDCIFNQNQAAVVGGGISWHGGTELLNTQQTNYFAIYRSLFVNNQAQYGSAIQINKEYFDLIANGTFMNLVIDSCNFTSNRANIPVTSAPSGIGVVSASNANIHFSGYTIFSSNNSTALVGDEIEIRFLNNSVSVFQNNSGFLGGAVLLMSSSWITVHYNTTLIFLRNTAVIDGGAIYVHFSTLFDYLISYSCFFRYFDVNVDINHWKARLIFAGNTAAGNKSNSIFATTLRPCRNTYSRAFLSENIFCFYTNATMDYSKFTDPLFDRQLCINYTQGVVSTSPTRFCNVFIETVLIIPGKVHDFNVCLVNELDSAVTGIQFVATCVSTCSDINTCADPTYNSILEMPYVLPEYRTNNGSIQIAGTPGSTCQLQLQTIEDFQITATWLVKMLNCPPGFIHSERDDICTCLTSREHQSDIIPSCEQTLFQAYVNRFYWIGYRSDNATDLLVGPCPYQYCYQEYSISRNQLLPAIANKTGLDKFVCGNSRRTSTLCGKCKDGYSVTLNSPTFVCHKCDDEYKLGFLYLLLSYIVPVSLLFFIIMTWNVRMTNGPIGAFLFFSQIISSEFHYILVYSVNANEPATLKFFNAILGIYSISNLDFFNHEVFSYCLFPRAGTIDIVAFELLLSLYPILLITAYSLFRKYYYIFKRPWCCRRLNFSNKSVTHGICAFLVLCFSKINLQAFTILIPAEITYIDNANQPYKMVVYLQGELEYFKEIPHTLYALGSILFIITVIALPTLILFFHPLLMQIVVYFRWGESKTVLLINKCLMVDKLKPVLDSFQGNYKDNFFCFAGLQIFFYRSIFFLIVVTTTPDIDKALLLITGYFVVILLIHNLATPFKRRLDNAVYSIVYTLMLAITIIELYAVTSGAFLDAVVWLQIILCMIPLVCFVSYYAWRLIQVARRLFRRFKAEEIEEDSYYLSTLPERLLDSVADGGDGSNNK